MVGWARRVLIASPRAAMKILVADDDKVLGHVLTAAFRKRGWETVTAVDGMRTMLIANQKPPGLHPPGHRHARWDRPRDVGAPERVQPGRPVDHRLSRRRAAHYVQDLT
jgi:hypothetical protein